MSYCTRGRGVVVAVDFGHWGGPVVRSCGTTPTTGYALLNQNGLRTTGTQHDGPAFVCRISYAGFVSGEPRPDAREESCVLTPGANAYWSYWHASPGSSTWSYSKLGAMSHEPEPGSVDLWTFGGTDLTGSSGSGVPVMDPDSLRPAAPAPATPTGTGGGAGVSGVTAGGGVPGARPGTGTPPGAGGGSAAPSGVPTSPDADAGAADRTSRTPLETVTGSPPPAGASRAPGEPRLVLDAPGSPAGGPDDVSGGGAFDTGSPVPALITLGVVLLLGGAGVLHALRRPRRED